MNIPFTIRRGALVAAVLSSFLPIASVRAMTLQEAYALKGSGTVAAELKLAAAGAPAGGLVVSALARPGQADQLLAQLNALGLEHGASAGRLVTGRLPYSAVPKLDRLASLHSVRPSHALFHAADPGAGRQGAGVGHGDLDHFAAAARTRFQVDGSGVKVGVLSDSFNCQGLGSSTIPYGFRDGDVPADMEVLSDPPCDALVRGYDNWQKDEGQRMLAVIHDLAPGAALAFHSSGLGAAHMAQGIRALADAGATVIVDDTTYLDEPIWQDGGPIADAVKEVVARGVAYVAAAGNFGRKTYEAPFRPSGVTLTPTKKVQNCSVTYPGPGRYPPPNDPEWSPGGCHLDVVPVPGVKAVELHDFDPGPGVDTCQRVVLPNDSLQALALHWDQPYASIGGGPGASSDLDLFLMDENCQGVLAVRKGDFWSYARESIGAAATNNIGGDPVETLLTYVGRGFDKYMAVGLAVGLAAGPAPNRLRLTYTEQPWTFNTSILEKTDAGGGGDSTSVPRLDPVWSDGTGGNGAPPAVPRLPDTPEYGQEGPTLFGHANLPEVVAVGAVHAGIPKTAPAYYQKFDRMTEPFSALGGTALLFDEQGNPLPQPIQRLKPDIAGVDGYMNTVPGEPSLMVEFFGTSATAAHIASVVALARQAVPSAAPARLAEGLRATAMDLDDSFTPAVDAGYDPATGYGLADAENLIAHLLGQPQAVRDTQVPCASPTAILQPGARYRGTPGPDVVQGAAGNEIVRGLGGNDALCGGPGNDKLIGGPGNDILIGGPGNDILIGGAGADVFRFSGTSATGADRIMDLGAGDTIEIVGLRDANGDTLMDAKDVTLRDTPAGAVITALGSKSRTERIVVAGRPAARVRKALRFTN